MINEGNPELASTAVGYLTPERLFEIPPQFHARHEFLIYVFVLIQNLVVETQENTVRGFSLTPKDIPNFDGDAFAADPIGYAAKSCPQAKRPILLDVSLALMADFYIFLHHALTAFERRQFTAGYANLRKPFRENLLLLSWICADGDEFFDKFLTDPVKAFNSGALSPEKRKQIFDKATKSGLTFADFPEELVENLVFSRTFDHGFGPSFDKATHLVTSKEHMRTEEMNLNFIFKDPRDDDVYEVGYLSLSLLVLYAYLVIYSVCDSFNKQHRHHQTWLFLAVWSAYEAIFLQTKSKMFASFEKHCHETFRCMFCASAFSLTHENIPRLVMIERIECCACHRDQEFPLYWLFCHEADTLEKSAQTTS